MRVRDDRMTECTGFFPMKERKHHKDSVDWELCGLCKTEGALREEGRG